MRQSRTAPLVSVRFRCPSSGCRFSCCRFHRILRPCFRAPVPVWQSPTFALSCLRMAEPVAWIGLLRERCEQVFAHYRKYFRPKSEHWDSFGSLFFDHPVIYRWCIERCLLIHAKQGDSFTQDDVKHALRLPLGHILRMWKELGDYPRWGSRGSVAPPPPEPELVETVKEFLSEGYRSNSLFNYLKASNLPLRKGADKLDVVLERGSAQVQLEADIVYCGNNPHLCSFPIKKNKVIVGLCKGENCKKKEHSNPLMHILCKDEREPGARFTVFDERGGDEAGFNRFRNVKLCPVEPFRLGYVYVGDSQKYPGQPKIGYTGVDSQNRLEAVDGQMKLRHQVKCANAYVAQAVEAYAHARLRARRKFEPRVKSGNTEFFAVPLDVAVKAVDWAYDRVRGELRSWLDSEESGAGLP